MTEISKTVRVRFSQSEFDRLRELAKRMKKPFASVVRAMCRLADDDEKRLHETICCDSIRRGRMVPRTRSV